MDTVTQLETYLRGLARRRKTGTVTADDAHRFLDRQGVNDTRTKFINSVLNVASEVFTPVGVTTSGRPVAKCRKITIWELTA